MDLIDQVSSVMLLVVCRCYCYWHIAAQMQTGHRIDLGSAEYVRLHTTTNFKKRPYYKCGKTLLNLIPQLTAPWNEARHNDLLYLFVTSFGLANAQRSLRHQLFWSCWQIKGLHRTNELLTNLNKPHNKLTDQNRKVGLTIKWQISRWKTHESDRNSPLELTALLTNQGKSFTTYNSLWHSVTVSNNPFTTKRSYSPTDDYDMTLTLGSNDYWRYITKC